MIDDSSESQQSSEILRRLTQEATRASAGGDFEKAAKLRQEILQFRNELETKLSRLQVAYQRKQHELEQVTQETARASRENDYENAAQLANQTEQPKGEIATLGEQIKRLSAELTPLEEQIELRQLILNEADVQTAQTQLSQSEIDIEIGRRNFVRAVMLAQQQRLPEEDVRRLQELALEQYACEYRNAQGLQKLIEWYRLSKSEARRVIYEGLSEWKGYSGLQYDVGTMSHMTLQQFIDNFVSSRL